MESPASTQSRGLPSRFMPMPGGTVGAIGLELSNGGPSTKLAPSCNALDSNRRRNGGGTVARERGPTIFRLVPRLFMPMPGGPVGEIGWAPASVAMAGDPSIKPAPSCGVLDSNLPATGERTAAPGKSPTTSRATPTRPMPMPGGTVGATGLEVAVVVAAIGAPSIKPAPSCGVLDLSLAPIGKPTAARAKSRMTSRLCPTRLMPSTGSIGAIGLGGPHRGGTDTTEVEHGPLVRSVGLSSSELPRALDRLDVMHPAPVPIGAEPAATRCGEMVE